MLYKLDELRWINSRVLKKNNKNGNFLSLKLFIVFHINFLMYFIVYVDACFFIKFSSFYLSARFLIGVSLYLISSKQ